MIVNFPLERVILVRAIYNENKTRSQKEMKYETQSLRGNLLSSTTRVAEALDSNECFVFGGR